MKTGRWLAITVGTLIWSIALWFGLISLSANRTVAFATIALGMAFSLYAIAGFSGVADPATTGFRASLAAIGVATACLLLFWGTGIDTFAVVAPLAASGVGGALALGPAVDRVRFGFRVMALALVTAAITWVYTIDYTVYGLVAPLVVYPASGLGDRAHDRAQEVLAEQETSNEA